MATENYLAVDLGAGSGRLIVGRFDGARLDLDEIHRFPNAGVQLPQGLYWDVLRLFDEIKAGVEAARGEKPAAMGVDAWGVDFALLDRTGALIGNPRHYRDERTRGVMERVLELASREEIFDRTGLQFMEINSLYQLYAMKGSPALDAADCLLLMPDLFHYWLAGERVCETTEASTTQFYDPRRGEWARPLLERLGLPVGILAPLAPPGQRLGPLARSIADECGAGAVEVIAPGSHDTASAVAAIPAQGDDWAFLSSGTWSLLGVETSRPVMTSAVLRQNFTNEAGVGGRNLLLKNIPGLWLIEECRRRWAEAGEEIAYSDLIQAARQAAPFRSLIDVDDPSFAAPGDMPVRIAAWCERHGEPAPETPAAFARTVFESLALKYRAVLADLSSSVGRSASALHVVGGGSQNPLLSQFAADACELPVIAGPVEATAAGNALVQAMALGRIGDLSQLREVVRRSFALQRYDPGPSEPWAAAASRLRGRIAAA